MSWMPSEIAPSGFAMKSTAPSSRASSVASAPSTVRADTITTGQGRSSDDAVQTGETVHLRHVDIERDDVGGVAVQLSQRLDPVAGGAYLEIRLVAENLAEQLPHQRGVVDDEDLDHKIA